MELTPLKYFESLYPENTREKEIRKYLEYLKRGLSAQIIGLPGTGKSNILRLLAYNINARTYHFRSYEKIMHFTYIDSSEIKNRTLFSITKFILSSLSFSLGERRMVGESIYVKNLLEEGLSLNDEDLMFQYLKKALDYLSIEKKLSVVLLFDKFDTLVPSLTEDFFSNLSSLRNHAKYRFGTVFSLKRPLEETVDVKILSNFKDLVSGNEIYISMYDSVGIKFRLDYIEKAARNTVDKNIRNEMLTLTGGHAKLTKLSFEALVSESDKVVNLKSYLLGQRAVAGALDEIWESLMPGEKTAFKNNLSCEEIQNSHPYLVKTSLVTDKGISIPLFEEYIKTAIIDEQEKITYDSEKNEILKGNFAINEILSASEFKLLRFLLENKDKILSKDEIINSVWTDQKTQEGVTDQALDQIFYRLRKKIEMDPGSPKFIHTIKGQGYKFTDE